MGEPVIVAVDVTKRVSVNVAVEAVSVVVVFTGTEAVEVRVGASGERRAICWLSCCNSARISAARWDSKRFLEGERVRLVLEMIFTPTGIATTVGVWLAGGSAS
jgi:hypothetical protein